MEHLVASELGMTCADVRMRISGTEMFRWMRYFEWRAARERGEQDASRLEGEDFGKAFGAL